MLHVGAVAPNLQCMSEKRCSKYLGPKQVMMLKDYLKTMEIPLANRVRHFQPWLIYNVLLPAAQKLAVKRLVKEMSAAEADHLMLTYKI